jgi:hypothetical protein
LTHRENFVTQRECKYSARQFPKIVSVGWRGDERADLGTGTSFLLVVF